MESKKWRNLDREEFDRDDFNREVYREEFDRDDFNRQFYRVTGIGRCSGN
jgi:hypothetical protein